MMSPKFPAAIILVVLAGLCAPVIADEPLPPGPEAEPTMDFTRPSLLLRGSLAGVYVGYIEARLDIVRAGAGIGFDKVGVILSTGCGTVAPGGAGDYMLEVTVLPIELDITYGLTPDRPPGRPVLCVHGEYQRWGHAYRLYGGSVSVGAKWTFNAVSAGVQASWRRIMEGGWPSPRRVFDDHLAIGITLDIGGWWAVGRRQSQEFEFGDVEFGDATHSPPRDLTPPRPGLQ